VSEYWIIFPVGIKAGMLALDAEEAEEAKSAPNGIWRNKTSIS
jgi:hypothetical protein